MTMHWPYRFFAWLVSLDLFALMVLVSVDVVGRYLFGAPVSAGYELVQVMMGVLVFASLPLICERNDHIALGLVDHWFKGWLNTVRLFVVNLTSTAVLAFMTWRMWVNSGKLAQHGDTTAVLDIPLAPVGYFMTALCALSVLVLLAHTARQLRQDGSKQV